MTSIILGLLFIGLGIWGVACWLSDLLILLRGLGSISVLFGGIVAVVAGISSLRPRAGSK